MIFFLHIPKTAGTTFYNVVENNHVKLLKPKIEQLPLNYLEDNLDIENTAIRLPGGYKSAPETLKIIKNLSPHALKKINFIGGHVGYGFHENFSEKIKKHYRDLDRTPKDILRNVKPIYNQIVGHFLRDKDGNRWYGNASHYGKPTFSGYTGFLNCLENWGSQGIVDVHPLNHDLFLERLNITDWLQGNLCDGFEEMGSPYFGKLRTDNDSYMVRLARYTGNYPTNFRLYKLHGRFCPN